MPGTPLAGTPTRHHRGGPNVRVVIAPATAPGGDGPVEMLEFRIPIMDYGLFMTQAEQTRFIGITALSPDAEPDDEHLPGILGVLNDPARMVQAEARAWRQAFTSPAPTCHQLTFPPT